MCFYFFVVAFLQIWLVLIFLCSLFFIFLLFSYNTLSDNHKKYINTKSSSLSLSLTYLLTYFKWGEASDLRERERRDRRHIYDVKLVVACSDWMFDYYCIFEQHAHTQHTNNTNRNNNNNRMFFYFFLFIYLFILSKTKMYLVVTLSIYIVFVARFFIPFTSRLFLLVFSPSSINYLHYLH